MFSNHKNLLKNRSILIILAILFLITPCLFAQSNINMYGYFSVNYEQVGKLPDGEKPVGEYSYPHMNLMLQSSLTDEFRVYVNMAGDGANEINLRNFWGEYTIRDYFKIRVGKIYRPFGIYNEKLDATPTYLGIEPPELFDNDHLLVPRTNEVMLHGRIPFGANTVKYSFMTGNKEVIDSGKNASWDLNVDFSNKVTIGTSGYYSNEKGSPKAIGEGSPDGGILPWMAQDKNTSLGGYLQSKLNKLTVKAAYWVANHDATRDAAGVLDLYHSTYLNERQMSRFGLDQYEATGNINSISTVGDYTIKTWYLRLGYTIPGGTIQNIKWDIIPYAFWDYYENPETIASKTYGGDNEAGVSDDGKFAKPTIGIALKPSYKVAIKLDASTHLYQWNGEDAHYEEVRFDVSFFFN